MSEDRLEIIRKQLENDGERISVQNAGYMYDLIREKNRTIAALKAEVESYRKDALMLRRIREIRGKAVGEPCACEFEDDGETIVQLCAAHDARERALKAEVEKLKDELQKEKNFSAFINQHRIDIVLKERDALREKIEKWANTLSKR